MIIINIKNNDCIKNIKNKIIIIIIIIITKKTKNKKTK